MADATPRVLPVSETNFLEQNLQEGLDNKHEPETKEYFVSMSTSGSIYSDVARRSERQSREHFDNEEPISMKNEKYHSNFSMPYASHSFSTSK